MIYVLLYPLIAYTLTKISKMEDEYFKNQENNQLDNNKGLKITVD